ncbi:hypothetical protein CVT26_001474 [Gymnopilus dilepis]|uniref:F-box domain-containing protein n=1 Tax=Gymnopilus dilepis TaxID=231916 RepID=A0A409WBD9_9AGAR|nr:hypothetical protein CVT26_001474 [Gymnopilus dilepis]
MGGCSAKSHGGLPQELLQSIFDIVVEEPGNFQTTKAFSCASSRLCAIAQPYLLRHVLLHPIRTRNSRVPQQATNYDPDYNPSEHLLGVLYSSPHIASYIRRLTLIPGFATPPATTVRIHWLDRDSSLPKLLPLLVNLEALIIPAKYPQRSDNASGRKTWSTISIMSRNALETAFTSQLTEVDITGIDIFPSSLLWPLSSLQRLSVSNIQTIESKPDPLAWVWTYRDRVDNHDAVAQRQVGKRRLDSLFIEEAYDSEELLAFSSPSWPFELDTCQTLTLSLGAIESIFSILKSTRSLRNLRLHTNKLRIDRSYDQLGYVLNHYDPFTFMPLPSRQNDWQKLTINSLTIEAAFTIVTFHNNLIIDHFTSPLSWLVDFLEASFESWTTETLSLDLSFPPAFSDSLFRYLDDEWRRLAGCLSSATFVQLNSICIHILGLSPDSFEFLQRRGSFQEMLSRDGIIISSGCDSEST